MTIEVKELRAAERYVADGVAGSFGSAEVTIVNLAPGGVQITHALPMRLGGASRISFRIAGVMVAATGRVIWSHLSKSKDDSGKLLYRSGVRIEDPSFAEAVQTLVQRSAIRRDLEALERKRLRLVEKERARSGPQMKLIPPAAPVSADEMLLVRHARERLRSDPAEAERLYELARGAQDAAGAAQDVVAVWEYLQRTIDIATIARVFDGGR